MIPAYVRLVLQRTAILLVVYFIARVLFLLWNWHWYQAFSGVLIVEAFWRGLRFDLSAIVLTNAALMLLWLLPAAFTRNRWLWRVELALFFVINTICVGSSFVDAEFVNFIGKRSGFEMLLVRQDLQRQGVSVILSYWPFGLGLLFTIGVATWFARPLRDLPAEGKWWQGVVWRVAVIAALVVGARGGFQLKPLHPMHAYFTTQRQLGLLALNTPFNVLKTRQRMGIERQRYFNEDRQAILHLRDMTKLSRAPLGLAKNFNVVVILVESLSTEYVGAANDYPAYTPFLDELAKESFFYKFNFANGRRSIEGLPAVICGIPAIMNEPVITSEFSNNRYDCLPNVLERRGYSTHFLHGAHNGSMHFDTFSKIAGFEHFVGLNEFPKDNPADFDQYWGVLDEPMLQYAVKVLDEAKRPSLVTVFTLSSHHPYYIPPQHRGKFPKGTLEIHESIGYADLAIREFFNSAKTKPWFNETVFVITGDHTQKSDKQEYINLTGAFRVPLYIYAPGLKGKNIPFDAGRVTQHIDILPSVLDLMGLELSERLLVGQSVFDTAVPGRAYNFESPQYWYMDDKLHFQMRKSGEPYEVVQRGGGMRFIEAAVDEAALLPAVDNLKAVVHYLNEGLIHNKLYGWRQSL